MVTLFPVAPVAVGVAVPKVAPQASISDRALSQAVSKAVGQLNENGFVGEGREITISIDPDTHRPVVRVVDKNTHEVLQQWPSKYVLQIAEDHKTRDSG